MEYLSTIIVGLIVAALFVFAVKKTKESRSKGSGCLGCSACAKHCPKAPSKK